MKKLRFLIFIFACLFPVKIVSAMSISSQTWSGNSVSPFNANCNGGNLMLIETTNEAGTAVSAAPTFNGVSSVLVSSATNGAGPTYAAIYQIVNPSPGVNSVVTSYASGAFSTGIICFSGTDTSAPIDASNCSTAGGGTGSVSVSLNTTVDQDFLADVVLNNNANAVTAGASQTEQFNSGAGGGGGGDTVAGSTKGPQSIGSQTMSWTATSFGQPIICAAAVTPGSGKITTTPGSGSITTSHGSGSITDSHL